MRFYQSSLAIDREPIVQTPTIGTEARTSRQNCGYDMIEKFANREHPDFHLGETAMRGLLFLGLMVTLTGCATHRVVVPLPVTGSENASPAETSNAVFWGQKTKPVQAERCRGSNALSEVRAETSFGAALATVLTLGFWQPLKVQYLCAKELTDVETIERRPER